MEETVLYSRDGRISLKPLRMTTYGFEVCRALKMKLETNTLGIERVRASIAELGYELHVEKAPKRQKDRYASKTSTGLRNYVFTIAAMR